MEQLLQFLQPLLETYAGKFGVIVQIVSVIGTVRIIVKPIMVAVEQIILDTESKKDDLKLEEVKKNKIFKTVIFLLDWFASVKIK